MVFLYIYLYDIIKFYIILLFKYIKKFFDNIDIKYICIKYNYVLV